MTNGELEGNPATERVTEHGEPSRRAVGDGDGVMANGAIDGPEADRIGRGRGGPVHGCARTQRIEGAVDPVVESWTAVGDEAGDSGSDHRAVEKGVGAR